MKRIGVLLISIIISALLISGCENPQSYADNKEMLDKAISDKILEENNDYLHGEVCGEGHIIMGTDFGKKEVYLLTMYGEYGFVNGNLTKTSGSGIIPAVAHIEETDSGYAVTSLEYPGDGTEYGKSIERLFPNNLQKRCFGESKDDYNSLKQMEQKYAKDYLLKIGRDAEVTEHESGELLTDLGVSVEVSNKLCEIEGLDDFYKFPYFIGNCEYVEDGKRMVYELSYKMGDKKIVYTKSEYDSGKVVSLYFFDAESGEEIK